MVMAKYVISENFFQSSKDNNKFSRYIIFNVWKSCGDRGNKIEQSPLAFCASDSLDLERDIATFEIQYPQRVGENWYGRASENVKGGDCKQRWSYWSDMTFDEVGMVIFDGMLGSGLFRTLIF